MESDNSDEEESKKTSKRSSSLVYKHGNAKLTREEYLVFHGHRTSSKNSLRRIFDSNDRFYPGLDVLIKLVPLSTV